MLYDTEWVVIKEELSPCFGINPVFDAGSPKCFLLNMCESKTSILQYLCKSQRFFTTCFKHIHSIGAKAPFLQTPSPPSSSLAAVNSWYKIMFFWQYFTAILLKLSNEQGMYHGLVLVATDGIVSLDRICWGINVNPKLDIAYDSNVSGIPHKIEHWSSVIFQNIYLKSTPSGYNSDKYLPEEVKQIFCIKIGAFYHILFGVFDFSSMCHIGLR